MIHRLSNLIGSSLTPSQMAWMYRRLPASMANDLAARRFRQTVRWAAAHSKFYREAFAARGIDARAIRKPSDLGDFFTTPQDLADRPEDFICRPPSIVFESSGTSGRNKQVFYDQAELREIGVSVAAGFKMMGLRDDDRVANAFDFSIWIPGLLCHYGLMAAGVFCQAFGKVDPAEVYRRMRQNKFTVVIGEPTWLIRLTQMAEADGSTYPLRLLIGGAEEMPEDAVEWMRKVWCGAQVKMAYGSVEQASGIGFQPCDRRDGYHIDYFDFLPEIVDIDAEGYGEMIFTTLRRRVMPLIRYRTRDVTRFETQPCPCGIPAPRMTKLRGRRDELVVASGGNLYPLMFEKIIERVAGLTHDWQVVFTLEGVREILTINVESERADIETIEADIHAQATDLYPDLMKNLAIGIFEMRVRVNAPGSVRTARKLKRVVDRRHVPPSVESEAEAQRDPAARATGGAIA